MTEQLVEKMLEMLRSAKVDASKFDEGNGAAGTRVRKSCLEVAKMAKMLRHQVQDVKNSRN
tara:strand:- start:480 stop:662 length:183 start_codon:yes stop_codon:yes gene_type:complete